MSVLRQAASRRPLARLAARIALPALAFALAACGTVNPDDPNRPTANTKGLGAQLLLGNTNPTPMTPPEDLALKRACPPVEVLEGAAAFRVTDPPNVSDPFAVRYQASLAESARECSSLGVEAAIRVGIVGRVIIGPKGAPGSFRVPLRIAVLDETSKPVFSQVRLVEVAVPAGETKADFTHIEDGISVPVPANRFKDWRIVIGYDTVAPPEPRSARRR